MKYVEGGPLNEISPNGPLGSVQIRGPYINHAFKRGPLHAVSRRGPSVLSKGPLNGIKYVEGAS